MERRLNRPCSPSARATSARATSARATKAGAAGWPIPVGANRWICLAVLVLAVASSGCRPQPSSTPEVETTPVHAERPEPKEALRAMIEAYAQAAAYHDRGELVLKYRLDGRLFEDAAPFRVAFEAPNRLWIQAYQAVVASDGNKLRARIDDPATHNLDRQFVMRPAPDKIDLEKLYEDQLLYGVLCEGLGRQPIQLELLFAAQPLSEFVQPADEHAMQLLDDRSLGNSPCYRVQVETAEGHFVFWIDQQSYVLRRLDYPVRVLAERMQAESVLRDVTLTAVFHEASFDQQTLDRTQFVIAPPTDARLVQRFLEPPRELPTQMFGQQPHAFVLEDLQGNRVTSDSFKGRLTVLHWYISHPACEASLRLFDQVAQQYAADPRVQFVAVAAEPSAIANDTLQESMRRLGTDLPILRDLSAAGRDVFQLSALPAVIALDPDGKVQLFEVTYNPELDGQLREAVDRLLQGDDLANEIVTRSAEEHEAYQRAIGSGFSNSSAN